MSLNILVGVLALLVSGTSFATYLHGRAVRALQQRLHDLELTVQNVAWTVEDTAGKGGAK